MSWLFQGGTEFVVGWRKRGSGWGWGMGVEYATSRQHHGPEKQVITEIVYSYYVGGIDNHWMSRCRLLCFYEPLWSGGKALD